MHAQNWVKGTGQIILMQKTLKLEYKSSKENRKTSRNKLLFELKK